MPTKLPVYLSGTITRFKGDGRKLGYPTANITAETDLKDGVYFGFADLAEWKHQPALVFTGIPTTMGETARRVEAYLLDIPDNDYYSEILSIELHAYHRPNQNFNSIDDLKNAIRADELSFRKWLAHSQGKEGV